MSGVGSLLERERELAALSAALSAIPGGDGPLVCVRGAAGIGKTRLLEASAAHAREAGLAVLSARGGAMERDLVYGVASQLLERRVFGSGAAERRRLLAGPARLAEAALRVGSDDQGPFEQGALDHGLYWLIANLTESSPLLIVVDDAHWADTASLQFLLHLARRRAGLPLGILIGARSDEPGASDVLDRLVTEPGGAVIEPTVLTASATSALVAERAGVPLSDAAGRAAHEVTGGNPFFAGEVGAALRGVPDGEGAVELVRSLVPSAVRHALLLRIGRLGPEARATAEALAVLGEDAAVTATAEVAGYDRDAVLLALAALSESGLTAPDAVTRFRHPIIRTAIHGDLTAARRALLHERAAHALESAGAGPERVAHHLLGAEPAGRERDAEILAAAGRAALRQGDAAIAASLLGRAAIEPPSPAAVAGIRFELGRARLLLADPAGAAAELSVALAADPEPALWVEITMLLSDALSADDQIEPAIELLAAAEQDAGDAEVRLRFGVGRAWLSLFHPPTASAAQKQMRAYAALSGDTPAQRGALANAAISGAFVPTAAAPEIAALARRALGGGVLVAEETAGARYAPPIYALLLAGDLVAAAAELEHVQTRARERGSVVDALVYENMMLELRRQRGELGLAAAHGEATVRLGYEWGDHAVALRVLSLAVCGTVEVLLEQGKTDLARETVAKLESVYALDSRPELVWGLQARAMLALEDGDGAAARRDLDAVASTARAVGYQDRTAAWRPWAARALVAVGEAQEAAVLLDEELELCRAWGAPMPLATALRAAAMLGDPASARELLLEADGLLDGTPFALEAARVITDLGIVERREGRRTAARETLARGADAAAACGAVATAERARAELVLFGARPRRLRLRGVDALTPSELRVATLASAGLSNREISQELFVSPKTVESHLGRVYGKLDVSGRGGLAAALSD